MKVLLLVALLCATAWGQEAVQFDGAVERVDSGGVLTVRGRDFGYQLPGFKRGLALYRHKRYWTSPVFVTDPAALQGDNVMLLWQRDSDPAYHVLLPTGVGALRAGRATEGLVYATGEDPYETLERAASQVGTLRRNKPYPEALRSLGWCSWNAFYDKVDRDKVLQAARSIRQAGIPARFILIDDGWMTVQGRKLAGLDAASGKFPGGLASLVPELERLGFPYVGVWHTLQGYWDGTVPGLTPGLAVGLEGLIFPDPRGTEFYADWAAHLRQAGIDFVKVDNQAGESRFTDMPEACAGAQRFLQAAWGNNILNCMEMSVENVYHYTISNVARSSDDYLPGEAGARHVFHNAYNALWLSQFATPDYDMFESGLPDGAYHALARALSGGPIYFTDRPGKADAELLHRLCYANGRLLQPDAPGRVAKELLFVDPTASPVALELEAPVSRAGYQAQMVGCFNVNTVPVKGSVGAQGSVCYLDGRAGLGRQEVSLPPGGSSVAYVVPVERGVAVLGVLDKYLAPATVMRAAWTGDLLTVELYEGGKFAAWLENAPSRVLVESTPAEFTFQDHLLVVPTPVRNCRVLIHL